MTARFLIITADEVDDTQVRQIQNIIARDSDDWWHQQRTTWIVKTEDKAPVWRDRFIPIIDSAPSTLLVLKLDPLGGFAGRTPAGSAKLGTTWLREEFLGKKAKELSTSADFPRTAERPK